MPLTVAAVGVLKGRMQTARGPYLFPRQGNPAKPLGSLQRLHEAALKHSGVQPRFRIYDLRHTFGSRLSMAEADLPTLKELMGHSHISTTMRYVHPTPEHMREAVRKLERFNAQQGRAEHDVPGSPQKSPQTSVRAVGRMAERDPQVVGMAEREGFEPSIQVFARITV